MAALTSPALVGCGGAQASPSAPSDHAAGPTKEKAPAKAGDAPSDAEAAEPPSASFEELRTAVMACPTDAEGDIESTCDAYTKWNEESPAFAEGKSNAALMKMLQSSEPKVRLLAAEKLRVTLTTDETKIDAATVDTVLGVAEKERDERLITPLAELVAGLDLVKTEKVGRAIAVAKAHPNSTFAEGFMFSVGSVNHDKALVAYAVEGSSAKSSSVRNASLSLAASLVSDFPVEACKTIDRLRADKDHFVATRAASQLGRAGACSAHFDKLLDGLAAVDIKKDVDQNYGYAINDLCGNKSLTPKQRSKANKAARRISDAPAVKTNTRYYTLSAVMRCDPKDGPSYVAKWKSDKDTTIAQRAADLVK
jgi:hypothetical protein